MAIIIKACLIKTAHSHLQQMEAEVTKKKYCEYFGLQQTAILERAV